METIDLPIHLPTAIAVAGILVALWSLQFLMRRRPADDAKRADAKPKRRYSKKRTEPQEPVGQ